MNLDILETGVLNIIALVGILIYVGGSFLGSILEDRKNTIVRDIQNAEERLSEANKRLSEAQKQLVQTNVLINQIKNETIATKKTLLQSEVNKSKKELTIRFNRALAGFQTKENQVFFEIKQQIIFLVLKRTFISVLEIFAKSRRPIFFMCEAFNKTQGDFI